MYSRAKSIMPGPDTTTVCDSQNVRASGGKLAYRCIDIVTFRRGDEARRIHQDLGGQTRSLIESHAV